MAGIYERDLADRLKVADVGDKIYVAQGEVVPFSRLLKRGKKPTELTVAWPAQRWDDVGFDGLLDGSDMAEFSHSNRDMIEGCVMWLGTNGWMVSRLAGLTKSHGVAGGEMAKQASDDGLKLARMQEKQLLSDMECSVESGAVPWRSRGVMKWLSATAQAFKPVPEKYRPAAGCVYEGALASFGSSNMETMLEAAATQKEGPVDLEGFCGIKLKSQMSSWAQRHVEDVNTAQALVRYNVNQNEKKLMKVVDFFVFDSGRVKTFPTWFLMHDPVTGLPTAYTPRSGAFLDLRMWELRFMDNPAAYVEPAKRGGPRGYHDAVYTLVCHNPTGQCAVRANT